MQLNVCISAALDVHVEFLLKLEKIFSHADGHIEKIFIKREFDFLVSWCKVDHQFWGMNKSLGDI